MQMINYIEVLTISVSDKTMINSQRPTPSKRGFVPTFLMDEIERPVPIRNKVNVIPFFEIGTTQVPMECACDEKVLKVMAATKSKMKYGNFTVLFF